MSAGAVQSSHWKTTSPIPPDPVYEKYPKNDTQRTPLRNPIPQDPIYTSPSERRLSSPKPRVKPEALKNARNHQGKDLAYLFNPAFQIIPIGVRPTTQENKNYGKENFKKIKQIQRANKEKQVDSARQTPVKAVYKPNKFDHVQSKVALQTQTPQAPRPSTADARMRRTNSMSDISKLKLTEKKHENSKTNLAKGSASKRPASARSYEDKKNSTNTRLVSASGGNDSKQNIRPKSHIVHNKESLKNVKLKRSPSMSALDELKKKKENDFVQYKRGNVPKYLQNRKKEWKKEEEERIASIPDPTIPAGHSLLPEGERFKTLTLLKKSKQDMTKELQSLPFGKDTLRVKNHKDVLERKLQEIDAAMKIFSRPRVFVKDE